MKTSKRKRSPKSEAAAEAAVEVVSAPVDAGNAEPVVVAEIAPESAVPESALVESTAVLEAAVAEAPSAPTDTPADEPADEPVVVLAANCSVKDAAALKTSLCAVANESASVTLDASAVERVDTATMQLLCAFVRDRVTRKQGIVWRGQSKALHDAVRLLGVGALLNLDEAKGVAA